VNFDEWYRQSPTRLCGPSAEDLAIGHRARELYDGCGMPWDQALALARSEINPRIVEKATCRHCGGEIPCLC